MVRCWDGNQYWTIQKCQSVVFHWKTSHRVIRSLTKLQADITGCSDLMIDFECHRRSNLVKCFTIDPQIGTMFLKRRDRLLLYFFHDCATQWSSHRERYLKLISMYYRIIELNYEKIAHQIQLLANLNLIHGSTFKFFIIDKWRYSTVLFISSVAIENRFIIFSYSERNSKLSRFSR